MSSKKMKVIKEGKAPLLGVTQDVADTYLGSKLDTALGSLQSALVCHAQKLGEFEIALQPICINLPGSEEAKQEVNGTEVSRVVRHILNLADMVRGNTSTIERLIRGLDTIDT